MFNTIVTKVNVLAVSLFYVGMVYLSVIRVAPAGCDASWCNTFGANTLLPFFFPAIVILICTCITFFLRDEIFKFWIKFAFGWTFLSGMWVIFTPHHGSGALGIDDKPVTALSLSLFFIILSLLIILYKSYRLRGK
jgi:hypothetical protein